MIYFGYCIISANFQVCGQTYLWSIEHPTMQGCHLVVFKIEAAKTKLEKAAVASKTLTVLQYSVISSNPS